MPPILRVCIPNALAESAFEKYTHNSGGIYNQSAHARQGGRRRRIPRAPHAPGRSRTSGGAEAADTSCPHAPRHPRSPGRTAPRRRRSALEEGRAPDEDAGRTLTVEDGFPGHPRPPGSEGRAWPTRGAPLGWRTRSGAREKPRHSLTMGAKPFISFFVCPLFSNWTSIMSPDADTTVPGPNVLWLT